MKLQRYLPSIAVLAALTLGGCSYSYNQSPAVLRGPETAPGAPQVQVVQPPQPQVQYVQAPAPQTIVVQQPAPQPTVIKPPPIKVSAVGYGSTNAYSQLAPGQQKLMAMRAAKIDAYRSLAEQVYGVQITGNSTVGSFAMQNDQIRASVDAFVRGAKVVSINSVADGNFECTVELELPSDFRDCIVRGTCFPQPEVGAIGCVGPGCRAPTHVCTGLSCALSSGLQF